MMWTKVWLLTISLLIWPLALFLYKKLLDFFTIEDDTDVIFYGTLFILGIVSVVYGVHEILW